MNTFFSIVGTTSTGKTNFALSFAEQLLISNTYKGVVLLSADSRQVYKELKILSGSDIPSTFINKSNEKVTYSYFKDPHKELYIFGQSMLTVDEEWSVAHFKQLADEVCFWCDPHDFGLLIVGGTGLYHEKLQNDDRALYIPPDEGLRKKAADLTVEELQAWLKEINSDAAQAMNNSDWHNPRRLVRMVEKTLYMQEKKPTAQHYSPFVSKKHITIQLRKELADIEIAISTRIDERLQAGVLDEVAELQRKDIDEVTALSTIGVKEIQQYLIKEVTLEECKHQWQEKEVQYAKRQITWWKAHEPTVVLDNTDNVAAKKIPDLIDQYAE